MSSLRDIEIHELRKQVKAKDAKIVSLNIEIEELIKAADDAAYKKDAEIARLAKRIDKLDLFLEKWLSTGSLGPYNVNVNMLWHDIEDLDEEDEKPAPMPVKTFRVNIYDLKEQCKTTDRCPICGELLYRDICTLDSFVEWCEKCDYKKHEPAPKQEEKRT